MAATYGTIFRVTIFGESHSDAIGGVIDGIPSGILLDFARIEAEMARRAPGRNAFSTPRKETDIPIIQSGIFNGKTTGTPIGFYIPNQNTKSSDYTKEILRPSHADFTSRVKFGGANDYRGGGHSSGRLTAVLVFAGAIAKQVLEQEGIEIFAHIKKIGKALDTSFDFVSPDITALRSLKDETIPLIDKEKLVEFENEILAAKENQDSVGGAVEALITGACAGLGAPFFESVESKISAILFSVPAVKAVAFGAGTEFSEMRGSKANDAFCIIDGKIKTKTNHNGGINGGITNGMPIVVTTTIKPTPSIKMEQETVNIETMEDTRFSISGRHDPCIVQRAVPVVEAALAIAMLDMVLEAKAYAR